MSYCVTSSSTIHNPRLALPRAWRRRSASDPTTSPNLPSPLPLPPPPPPAQQPPIRRRRVAQRVKLRFCPLRSRRPPPHRTRNPCTPPLPPPVPLKTSVSVDVVLPIPSHTPRPRSPRRPYRYPYRQHRHQHHIYHSSSSSSSCLYHERPVNPQHPHHKNPA